MNFLLAFALLFSHYRGSVYLDAQCLPSQVEYAAVVIENHGPDKLSGALDFILPDLCGPVCNGIYTRPFTLPPHTHRIITYQAASLSRVDAYLIESEKAPYFMVAKYNNWCE